jgi:hypothetical protein
LEMDVNIGSSAAAHKALQLVMGYAANLVIDFAWVIEVGIRHPHPSCRPRENLPSVAELVAGWGLAAVGAECRRAA